METKFIRTSSDLKNLSQEGDCQVKISRRQLLLGLASVGFFPEALQMPISDIPVVVVTLPGKIDSSNPHYYYLRVWEEILEKMSRKRKPGAAAKFVLGKAAKYSVRIDCSSATSKPANSLVSAFLELLVAKGVQPWDIQLWDKRAVEAGRAGFNLSVNGQALKIEGVEKENYRSNPLMAGYNGKQVYRPDWFDNKSRFPLVDALSGGRSSIVFTTAKYHRLCGIEGALAATALGAIGRSGKLLNSSENMIRAICEIWKQFLLKNNILTVVDATSALFEGGPVGLPYYKFNARKLIIGRDPVAVDKVALDIIDKKREEVKYASASESGEKLLEQAEKMGLGSLKTKVVQINFLE